MKHKLVMVMLSVALIVGLALVGCVPEAAPEEEEEEEEEEEAPVEEVWPTKPIALIIPFKAGGSVDRMARGIAPFLQEELGVPIVVENRKGASGQIGATHFTQLPDDGQAIFVATQPYLSANILIQGADFAIDDFAIVNVQVLDPITVLVHADSPYMTLKELVEAIKAKPDTFLWGSIFGGAPYLSGLALFDKLGLDVREVLYDSGADYRAALLGKHVDFVNGTAAGDLVLGEQARALVVYSESRFSGWPDAVPINEALEEYGVSLPTMGSMRYVATLTSFKEKHPDRWEIIVNAWERAFNNPGYQKFLEDQGWLEISAWNGPETSEKLFSDFHLLMEEYKEQLTPK